MDVLDQQAMWRDDPDNQTNVTLPEMYGNPKHEEYKRQAKVCGEHFFEQFLDGSAGVMVRRMMCVVVVIVFMDCF